MIFREMLMFAKGSPCSILFLNPDGTAKEYQVQHKINMESNSTIFTMSYTFISSISTIVFLGQSSLVLSGIQESYVKKCRSSWIIERQSSPPVEFLIHKLLPKTPYRILSQIDDRLKHRFVYNNVDGMTPSCLSWKRNGKHDRQKEILPQCLLTGQL